MKERIHSCTKKKEEMIMGRKRFKKLTALTLAVAMVFTMNGMSTLSSSAKTKAKKKVALNKTSLSLKVGQKKKLTVKNKPAKAKLKWSTSNKKVATVKNGKVKAFEEKCDRMPYAISIDIAPLSMMVFKYDYVDKKPAIAKKAAVAKTSTENKSVEKKTTK